MDEPEIIKEIEVIHAAFITLVSAMAWEVKTSQTHTSKLPKKYADMWQDIWKWIAFLVREDRPRVASVANSVGFILHVMFIHHRQSPRTMVRTMGFLPLMADLWASLSISRWRSLKMLTESSVSNPDAYDWSLPAFILRIIDVFPRIDSSQVRQFLGALGATPAQMASNCLQSLTNALKDPCLSYLDVSLRIIVIASDKPFQDFDAALLSQGSVPLISHLVYRLASHRKPTEATASNSDHHTDLARCFDFSTCYIFRKVLSTPSLIATVLQQRIIRALLKCGSYIARFPLTEEYCSGILQAILPYLVFPAIVRLIRRCLNSIDYVSYINEMEDVNKPFADNLTLFVNTLNVREKTYRNWPRFCEAPQVRVGFSSL